MCVLKYGRYSSYVQSVRYVQYVKHVQYVLYVRYVQYVCMCSCKLYLVPCTQYLEPGT